MSYTQAKIDAMAKLDEAAEACVKAFESFAEHTIPVGYVLLVVGTKPVSTDEDYSEPDDDDMEMMCEYTHFPKRGQMPVVTRGIVDAYVS